MQDHTFADGAQMDTTESGAVTETQKDTLLAGKYKSKEDLLDATAQIFQQVEGRTLSPSEVLDLASKDAQDLELAYKSFERQFHNNRPAKQDTESADDVYEALKPYLGKFVEENGFVKKAELERQRYEEEELSSYFASNPSARSREQLIKSLAQTEQFKDKSFAEVDKFIAQHVQPEAPRTTPNVKLGSMPAPEKSLDEMSDAEFAAMLSKAGNTLY